MDSSSRMPPTSSAPPGVAQGPGRRPSTPVPCEDPEKGRQFLGYLRREIVRLESLVQDLLDLHKMEAGVLAISLRLASTWPTC